MILAGDIGGTNTRLALIEQGTVQKETKFPSRKYPNLQSIILEFLEKHHVPIQKACFGIAGPVRRGRCQTTNLPWIVDAQELKQELKIPWVKLLNDLEANAFGMFTLSPKDFFLLQKGEEQEEGNQALISAGTGLGEACLFWDGHRYHPFASEGGHVDFSPRNEEECELFKFLQKEFSHVSYERVVSGPGLYNIYRFLTQTGREKACAEIEERMKQEEPPRVITHAAIEKKDQACIKSVERFASFYGAEAGNLALKCLALQGVFLGGGIAPYLLDALREGEFVRSFCDKGRFKSLLEAIPIRVVLNDNTALLGAGYFAEHFDGY